MSDDPFRPATARPSRTLSPHAIVAALGVATLAAACARIWQSLGTMLWLDELYTTTLIDTASLSHMLEGALRGVDGNPPLYLSLCWLLTHALPLPPEPLLRAFNLVVLAATAMLQYRIGRRLADPVSVAAALVTVNAVDGMGIYALLEMRTYALYLLLSTATLWATLRLVDRSSAGRVAVLAGCGTLAVLTHSFGGFYVLATLGAAALAARDRRRALAVAAVPVLAATAGWISLSLPSQLAVATPYGWILPPDGTDLAQALTGSLLLTPILLAALCLMGLRGNLRRVSAFAAGRPDIAALVAILAAYAALTLAGWLGSQVITPFFVGRYFIPNLTLGVLSTVAAVGGMRRVLRPGLSAVALGTCILAGLVGVGREDGSVGGFIPCRDEAGQFLEADAAGGGLPVVAESPAAWLPRARYAPGQATLYALDWDVVLRHPFKARNNAMDFHIMEILRDWGAPRSALSDRIRTTADILAGHARFLVLDELDRGWFDELRATVPVSATLLKRGPGCRLWAVTRS